MLDIGSEIVGLYKKFSNNIIKASIEEKLKNSLKNC